jgi:RHS repeat-associated protein
MQLGSDVRPQNGLLAEMTLLAEKPRQGVPTSTNALHRGFGFVISSTSLGIIGSLYDEGIGSRSTGKERDTESGNDYMFARYYNSATGRFLSPDWDAKSDDPVPYAKLDNPQSLNLYAYVLNNPVGNLDPNGHETPWGSDEGSLRTANIVAGAAKGTWNLAAGAVNLVSDLLFAGVAGKPQLPMATYSNPTQNLAGDVTQLGLIIGDAIAGLKTGAAAPSREPAALPESYWKDKQAPTQVAPGTRQITEMKPSSRSQGEVYERTTQYDEYGRSTGQTHRTSHGEPSVHPNPHHHLRNPKTGQTTGPHPGVHPDD